ncbi:flippase-like domain-containing protein, partial [bacterium]|nr:flippase-like domain-containing protein [bacterium]
MRSGWGGLLLKLAVSLFLVVWLVRRYGGDQEFRATLSGLHPGAFAAAAGIIGGGLVISALRWKVLLAAAGVPVSLARATRLYFIGYFFNLLLPTTVGGDVVRASGIGRAASLSLVGGSIVIERLLGFGCLLGIGITASLLRSEMAAVRTVLLAAGAAYVVGVVLLATVTLAESGAPGRFGRALR